MIVQVKKIALTFDFNKKKNLKVIQNLYLHQMYLDQSTFNKKL